MFGRDALKTYTVHHKEGKGGSTVFIREGFAPLAFLFGCLWLFAHRAWLPAFLTLALAMLVKWMEMRGGLDGISASMLQFTLQLWIGFEARDWYREALERRGYHCSDIVLETSEPRAELRYYERHMMVSAGIRQSTADAV